MTHQRNETPEPLASATPITEAFDALMPFPFDYLYEFASPFGGTTLRESASEYNGNRPKRSIAIYTADQLHEAIRAATERAAKQEWLPMETAPRDQPVLLRVPTTYNKWTRMLPLPGRWFGSYFAIYNADEAIQRVEPLGWMPMPGAAAIRASGGMGAES